MYLSEDEQRVFDDQVRRFKELLFSETEADLLAASDATVADARRLLDKGCSHHIAVKILV